MTAPQDTRENLCNELLNYARLHSEQADCARRVIHFVANTPDCFSRSHASGHITGSAWLLSPDGSMALLTLHRKLGKWLQLGGHADGDADILRVAMREAQEESGISGIVPVSAHIFDVDIHRIPARPTRSCSRPHSRWMNPCAVSQKKRHSTTSKHICPNKIFFRRNPIHPQGKRIGEKLIGRKTALKGSQYTSMIRKKSAQHVHY